MSYKWGLNELYFEIAPYGIDVIVDLFEALLLVFY